MILDSLLAVDADAFATRTGWEAKPEGMCRGEVCVPAPGARHADGSIDVERVSARLGMPLVHDDEHGVWALGPATVGGRALDSAVASDPPLLARDGSTFRLSSLHGREVVLVAWASY